MEKSKERCFAVNYFSSCCSTLFLWKGYGGCCV